MRAIKKSGLWGLCGGVSSSLGGTVLVLCLVLQAGSGPARADDPAPTGSIVGWGEQVVGVDLSSGFESVAAGYYHSLGLKTDGSIVAWGYNNYGQCDVPSPNTDFTAVAAGRYHSLGLKSDGSIVAWGYNYCGQCDVPEPNTDFTAVAAGRSHSVGLKTGGSIVAWGSNYSGQCDVPEPNTDFTAVAAGYAHNLGIRGPAGPEPAVTAWRSMRFHGGSVNDGLAIELDASATGSDVVSEPRRDGIQRIEVDIAATGSITLTGTIQAEDVTVGGGGGTIAATNQGLIDNGDGTYTVWAEWDPGLPDEACYEIDLADNVVGLIGDTDCLIVGLQGDTNGDGNTNLIDMAQTKSKNGQPVLPDNIRFDVNLDGNINLIDMALVKSLNGGSATCP